MAGRKWSEEFILNPFTNIRGNDILNLTRQGSPNTSGDGEIGVLTSRYTQINVNNAGSDENGDGSLLAPLKTVQGAYDYIAGLGDASITKQYMICKTGAITDTAVALRPFVHMDNDGSPWYVSSITLHASFNAAVQVACYYQNLAFASNCDIDLQFADGVGSGYGYLNFIDPRCIRVGATATPTVNFTIASPEVKHHVNFYNPIFSEPNDGGQVSIFCGTNTSAALSIIGGTGPKVIDFSTCTGGYMIINGMAADGTNGTSITVNNTPVVLQNILNSYGSFSIEALDNNSISYDASIGNPSTCISETGTGNDFIPFSSIGAIYSNYGPVNFSYPTPLYFGNYPTVHDALKGIDNALASFAVNAYPPGYVNGGGLMWTGFTTVLIDPISCLDSSGTYNISAATQLSCDISTNGAGGLDTGSAAANTPYALYVIAKSTVVGGDTALVVSADFSAPDLTFDPTYDKYRYIGRLRTTTGAAQLIAFSCIGNSNTRTYYITTSDSVAHVLTAGTATTPTTVSCTAWTNVNYTKAIGFKYVLNCGSTAATVATLTSNSFADAYWTRGLATSVLETDSTGLMPINDNGSVLNYQFSAASTGRTLDLYVNMVQEFI